MKQIFFILLAVSLGMTACENNETGRQTEDKAPDEAHNAANSLDIAGLYVGEFPCEDCPGIILSIALDSNRTYTATTTYKGNESNEFPVTGKWTIKENTISMTEDSTGKVEQYFAGENFIQQMDTAGNRMYGEQEDEFVLRKKSNTTQAIP